MEADPEILNPDDPNPDLDDEPNTPVPKKTTQKPKRAFIWTEGRREAWRKATEARAHNVEMRKEAKKTPPPPPKRIVRRYVEVEESDDDEPVIVKKVRIPNKKRVKLPLPQLDTDTDTDSDSVQAPPPPRRRRPPPPSESESAESESAESAKEAPRVYRPPPALSYV